MGLTKRKMVDNMPHVNEEPPPDFRYRYKATVMSIYDADTLTLLVDLGFSIYARHTIRLARINAWEIRGNERQHGLDARDWLRSELPNGSEVEIRTMQDKTGKYGRYIAEVFMFKDGLYACVNDELVTKGHARYQEY